VHQDGSMYGGRVAVLSLGSTGTIHFYESKEQGQQHAEQIERADDCAWGEADTGRIAHTNTANERIAHTTDTDAGTERSARTSTPQSKDVFLEPRSLLVFDGDAYTHWYHAILPRAHDTITSSVLNLHLLDPSLAPGDIVPRDTRVSLTVRRVLRVKNAERTFATAAAAEERRRAAAAWQRGVFDGGKPA
jgi:hypothetical protein